MAKAGVRFQPTAEQRRQVTVMAGYGVQHKGIALLIGIAKDTLYKHFRKELDLGEATANMQLGRSLFEQAVGRPAEYDENKNRVREEMRPDRSVSIFMGKARLGLKDTQYIETTISDLDLTKLDEKDLDDLERILRKAGRRPTPDNREPAAGDQPRPRPAARRPSKPKPPRKPRSKPGGQ